MWFLFPTHFTVRTFYRLNLEIVQSEHPISYITRATRLRRSVSIRTGPDIVASFEFNSLENAHANQSAHFTFFAFDISILIKTRRRKKIIN